MYKKDLRFIARTKNRMKWFIGVVEGSKDGWYVPKNLARRTRGLDKAVGKMQLTILVELRKNRKNFMEMNHG